MWANVMRSIHDGFSGARFYQPSKIVTAEICTDTGEIARTGLYKYIYRIFFTRN